MAVKIDKPTVIEAAGNKIKIIKEFIGRINTANSDVSIAQMKSPDGWIEPGQTPEFTEYTVVLSGQLKVETKEKTHFINAGEAINCNANEWVRYSSPEKGGAEYIAVCMPAFSPETVHRDEE
ncbi:MAG TPA: hypothetical protein QF753_11785 [Victivallales bacterium]|nr:hypothetical protein [Victivallales bacterium]